jgi:hypothetical protein
MHWEYGEQDAQERKQNITIRIARPVSPGGPDDRFITSIVGEAP